QVDGLRKVYEIFTSLSVDPGVKKSAVDQLAIILQDNSKSHYQSLEHESRERCDAVPYWLAVFMQQCRFVALLLVMSDLLPVLANLSIALQMRDAVYNAVGTLVMGAITTVRSIKEHPGQNFQHLPQAIDHLTEQSFRFTRPKPCWRTDLPAFFKMPMKPPPKYRVLKNTITQDTTLRQATTTVLMLKVSGPLRGAMPNLSLLATAILFLLSTTADCE
ncbi:hypothetical protein MAR_026198, partial [Mya arenaria]